MKKYIVIGLVLLLQVSCNPDQALQAASTGSSSEYMRRNQPPEHVIIPLINTQEASYNPFVAPDIREYRRKRLQTDKDIDFQVMMMNGK
jgi:hypothetical protein